MKNENGFTLIEMMIVMLIIAVLLIIMIPNVLTQQNAVEKKGCEAYIKTVEAQVQAYRLEHNEIPSMEQLVTGKYVKESTCPDGSTITISSEGVVSGAKRKQ
ncbi:competence type IV pilus major pilin ComGC [Priestia taiwanensis]|uniref:ComG operon protein 3 n=1 Tax=Priestia taiwanensis TaxID=1347902 RepID=A0A917EQP8_9BACI|nr:competence type IV pilus major pilin ComGC [Priestia taiwanensis]MBM7363811.1 type II secretion system protein G [Priestia taiwanensis]GGE73918.1 competence protein ComG [Priestia taiwanensis]